ncbi:carboxypeptidase regulatory-like domain-containing protein [Candidatus Sumerlaeota bacterium]|nr:carboxypeptidase regulatory-like domain-containing protein [Candidatus Sumerlaeota bacterium]
MMMKSCCLRLAMTAALMLIAGWNPTAQEAESADNAAAGRDIPLYVLDERGTELSGYRVIVYDSKGETVHSEWLTSDDERKRLSIPAEALTEGARVVVDKHRYAAEWLSGDLSKKDTLRVILRPEGKLKGSLFDAEGKPAADRYVSAYEIDAADKTSVALTDENGGFVIGSLAKGAYRLEIRFDEEAVLLENPERTVNVDYGQTVGPVELHIAKGYPVSGSVIDLETGQPVRATVWVSNQPGISKTPADAEGRYVISNLPAGWHMLQCGAEDENYISAPLDQSAPLGSPGVLQVLVRDAPLEAMDFRLQRGCALECRLLNAEGAALTERKVYLNSENPQISRLVRQRETVTSDDGKFQFKGLPENDDYYFVIQQNGDDSTTQPLQFTTARFSLSREESPKEFTIHLK